MAKKENLEVTKQEIEQIIEAPKVEDGEVVTINGEKYVASKEGGLIFFDLAQ